MQHAISRVKKFLVSEDGPTAVEVGVHRCSCVCFAMSCARAATATNQR